MTLKSGPKDSRLLGTTSEVSEGPTFKQEQIARAGELSLEVSAPTQMHIITDDPENEVFIRKMSDIPVKGQLASLA